MCARKYAQRGYQEDEPRERRERGRPAPRREGPRGRGLGAPERTVFRCARCGEPADPAAAAEATARCAGCGDDLHSCVNCRFFDTSAPNECRAGVEKRIAAKAKANDCDRFEAKRVQEFSDSRPEDDPRAAFDSLFDF